MIIKRYFIFVVFTIVSQFCFGQKVIQLTKQNGVYTIPCSINGVKRSLIFDTGASTVTISKKFADLLYSSGNLKSSDCKGWGLSQTASGHIVNNMAVVLRDIEIEGLHLKNIDAVILEGQNVPLLLGLSAIQKLGEVTLSGNRLIIDTSILTNPQLQEIRAQIKSRIEKEEYFVAITLLKKIESQEALEETDLFNLALCCCFSKDYNRALMYCQQWMGSYKGTNSSHESEVCYFMGLSYMELKSHYDADHWFANAIRMIGIDAVDRTSRENASILFRYYDQKGLNYLKAKAYENSEKAFDTAIQYRMRALGVTYEDLCTGKVKDERIGTLFYIISNLNTVFLHREEYAKRYFMLVVLCGNKEAVEASERFK